MNLLIMFWVMFSSRRWGVLLQGLKSQNYLVSSTFGVDEHKQRLHELRGQRFDQERLPAAVLKLGHQAETQGLSSARSWEHYAAALATAPDELHSSCLFQL